MSHLLPLLWAAGGTVGFALLFDCKLRDVPLAAVGAVLGWGIYSLALEAGSPKAAFFAAALVIGLWAEIVAVIVKRPASIYIVCAILPIVPGSGMYQTMLESVNGNLSGSLQAGFETLMAAGAIAAGLAVSSAISRLLSLSSLGRRFRLRWHAPRRPPASGQGAGDLPPGPRRGPPPDGRPDDSAQRE
jgi:uncharacterized membrane protein YjjB (DUF3815 family)